MQEKGKGKGNWRSRDGVSSVGASLRNFHYLMQGTRTGVGWFASSWNYGVITVEP